MKMLLALLACIGMVGCGPGFQVNNPGVPNTPNNPRHDDGLVVGSAEILLVANAQGMYTRVIKVKKFNIMDLLIPSAYAYNGGTPPSATLSAITYNNPASTVGFTIAENTGSCSLSGDTLSCGNFAISGLDDNTLNKCADPSGSQQPVSGNKKCNTAKIRVYSASGTADGVFCHSTDGYCIPLSVGGNAVGVGSAAAAYVQNYTIPGNMNRLRYTNLTALTANFPVSIDMSNAGSGSYSATLIVEYVLYR